MRQPEWATRAFFRTATREQVAKHLQLNVDLNQHNRSSGPRPHTEIRSTMFCVIWCWRRS